MSRKTNASHNPAFTIVELLIVIVVIGILATVTVVAYNGMQQRARSAALISDVRHAVTQLKLIVAETGSYPENTPNLSLSEGNSLNYRIVEGNYCLSVSNGTGAYHATSVSAAQPEIGPCPAGHWSFNGHVNDSSLHQNHGAASAITFVEDRHGRANSAALFNGSSVTIGNPDSLRITGSQSISMWLNPRVLNARRNPIAKAYGGEGTITQEISGALNYYYGTNGGNSTPYQGFGSGDILSENEWSHVVLVRDLAAMRLIWYHNGQQVSATNAAYPAATAGSLPLYIGRGYVSNYDGVIDDVRLYDQALTPAEVRQLYES
jgi:prepilin-type N-terminal cleavage/methylation domain-containing protein